MSRPWFAHTESSKFLLFSMEEEKLPIFFPPARPFLMHKRKVAYWRDKHLYDCFSVSGRMSQVSWEIFAKCFSLSVGVNSSLGNLVFWLVGTMGIFPATVGFAHGLSMNRCLGKMW